MRTGKLRIPYRTCRHNPHCGVLVFFLRNDTDDIYPFLRLFPVNPFALC